LGSKNILVTGGAGYIGSHTAKALAQAGYCPVVIDSLTAGHRWAVKWGPLIEGDIGCESLVRRVFDEYDIESVIHFAANAYVGESMRNPRKYFHNNVTKSLNLLNAMMDCGVNQIVFSSTCAVYGIPQQLPIKEDHPRVPINPYGETKLLVEKACHWYSEAHELRSVCLRYFNAAGADASGELGESHDPETHLIPLAIQAAYGLRPGITVFGTDYPTSDGSAVRDYIHVSDLAEAHVRALQFLAQGGESTTVNLGTGAGYSVRDVIHCVERVLDRRICVQEASRRPGDPAVLIASPSRAYEVLNWRPIHSSLEEIVATACKWHSSQISAMTDALS
jgi:UDP-arabinose 4-epimerase